MIEQDHLQYEINMLYITQETLGTNYCLQNPLMINVFHESFCVHAVNCVYYLQSQDVAAPEEITSIYNKIYDQVLTLGESRTSNMDEKLQAKDRNLIFQWIMKEWNYLLQKEQYETK